MQGRFSIFLAIFFLASKIWAQDDEYRPSTPIKCGLSQNCPEDWPCCSPYGDCGRGPICLGGCNPRFSFNETSCAPLPALVPPNSIEYSAGPLTVFDGNEGLQQLKSRGFLHFNKFLIARDREEADFMLDNIDFVYSGPTSLDEASGDVILTMPKHSSGSLLASTKSFLYGKSSVRLKTSRSQGVITSVVIMSAVGDEIDFEFKGSELDQVQSNYYYRGELVYNNMKKATVSSNTWENYHEYGIDWSEERIHWLVDGEIVRTLTKAETWDESLKIHKYPETPMRLEVALWPGGSEANHPGTVDWAGGLIDWEGSPDMVQKGHFSAAVQSMEIVPYNNRYAPAIQTCLEKEKHVVYDYISKPGAVFDDTSFALYCGVVPNLAAWSQTGSSIPRDLFRTATLSAKGLDPQKDFIQNVNSADAHFSRNATSSNGTELNSYPLTVETSGQASLRQRNIFYQMSSFLSIPFKK